MINESLLQCMSDETLAYSFLKSDILAHKIPEERMREHFEVPLEAGRKRAEEYAETDLVDAMHKCGIVIRKEPISPQLAGTVFRAKIDYRSKDKCTITVFKDSISSLSNACRNCLPSECCPSYDDILNMHLAHEFFHYLCLSEGENVCDRIEPIVTMKIGPWKRLSHIKRTDEIAAHKFAKDIVKVRFLPIMYDYIYMISCGNMSSKDLEEKYTDFINFSCAQ